MKSGVKKAAFALIATLVPLLLLACGAEILLRLAEAPFPGNRGNVLRASGDAEKQYELIPGAEGVVAGASVTINSFGCRDREYPVARPEGVIRIVGVGDSLTFGQGVAESDSFLARLEDGLVSRGLSVEVINCGVFGYNVNEETRRFLEVVELLDPDIIVIGYELGDLLVNPPFNRDAADATRAPRGRRSVIEMRGLVDLLKESRMVSFLAYRFTFLLKKFSLRNWDSLYADDSPLWRNLTGKYAVMGAASRAAGVDVAVLIVPELSNLDSRYPFKSVHERVASMCRAQGMRVLDLLPAFLGKDGPSLWVHPRDRHPNAEGQRIIADAILDPVQAMVKARAPVRAGVGIERGRNPDKASPR